VPAGGDVLVDDLQIAVSVGGCGCRCRIEVLVWVCVGVQRGLVVCSAAGGARWAAFAPLRNLPRLNANARVPRPHVLLRQTADGGVAGVGELLRSVRVCMLSHVCVCGNVCVCLYVCVGGCELRASRICLGVLLLHVFGARCQASMQQAPATPTCSSRPPGCRKWSASVRRRRRYMARVYPTSRTASVRWLYVPGALTGLACVCVRACELVCACVSLYACVCACVCAHVHKCARASDGEGVRAHTDGRPCPAICNRMQTSSLQRMACLPDCAAVRVVPSLGGGEALGCVLGRGEAGWQEVSKLEAGGSLDCKG